MKHLVKNIAVLWFSVLFLLLSIKSSYAEETYTLNSITATSTKTVELEFDKKNNQSFDESDLEIYKSINNTVEKDEKETNKIILKLESNIEKNTSYSLISLSSINWDMIFRTSDNVIWEEIQNNWLDSDIEWIKSILIKDPQTVILTFLQDIDTDDFEFQFLKTLEVSKVFTIIDTNKIKVTLKWEMLNNEEYLSTVTYFQNKSFKKITISKGVIYFTTWELKKYEWPSQEEIQADLDSENNLSLEESLMKALNESESSNSWDLDASENEFKNELNSASEDPANNEKTQLEELALSQKETPDSGAETWVILLATFIINTFYYLSRRKKVTLA